MEKSKNGKKILNHTGARQCHYCNNYFIRSAEKMEKHLSICSSKAGFTFSFDNGKIIDYQDQCKNLGDLPFTVYYYFKTTAGSVVFFDAKMYVVSYCIVMAFHPELKIPRLVIFRIYDQNPNALISLTHFQALQYDFFSYPENYNRTTLKQLEDVAFSVQNKEKNTALAEMFSIELKFTVDCLKFWFNQNHKILDVDIDLKAEFKQKHPLTKKTLCCLCDFPMDPKVENGWAEHVFKVDHLFLENVYSEKQMVMGIDKSEVFSKKLNKIFDQLNSFCASIESEKNSSNSEIEEIIEKIKKLKLLGKMRGKQPKKNQLPFYIIILLIFYREAKQRATFQYLTNI